MRGYHPGLVRPPPPRPLLLLPVPVENPSTNSPPTLWPASPHCAVYTELHWKLGPRFSPCPHRKSPNTNGLPTLPKLQLENTFSFVKALISWQELFTCTMHYFGSLGPLPLKSQSHSELEKSATKNSEMRGGVTERLDFFQKFIHFPKHKSP